MRWALAFLLASSARWAAAEPAEPAAAGDSAESDADTEPEVRVHGAVQARALRDPTAASTVIRGEALQEPGVDVARLLARAPGVQTTRSGSSADLTTLSLRGSSAAQVPVYVAGIRVQDEVTGVADLSRFPVWMLERIEIYRGTSPEFVSRFGMAGAVLLEPRFPQKNELRAGVELGSWNSQALQGGASVTSRTPNGAADERGAVQASSSVNFRLAHSDNDFTYKDDGGTAFNPNDDKVARRPNADFDSADLWSLSRFVVPTSQGPVRTDVVLNAFSREQGVTGLSQIPAQKARMTSERELGGLNSEMPCGLGLWDCSLGVSVRAAAQKQRTTDPWNELSLGADWVAVGTQRVDTRASLRVRPNAAWLAGLDLAYETGRLGVDQPSLARTRAQEQVLGATALAQWQRGAFESLVLFRPSCLEVQGSEVGLATQIDSCFVEGRWGGKWQFASGWALRSNVARAVRPPTLGERYGVSAGARGNPALSPEQGWSFDSGVDFSGRASFVTWQAELFGFLRFAEQLIAYQRSALGYVRPYNVNESRTLGAELALSTIWVSHLRAAAQLTALDPRDVSANRTVENDLIPLLSRLVVGGELEAFTETEGVLSRASLGLLMRYRGGRVADPAGLIVIGPQFVADLTAAVLFLERAVAVRARIENLMDTTQFDTVGYPLPGRSFYTSLELVY